MRYSKQARKKRGKLTLIVTFSGEAIEESQGAVGLPENDAERLPKSGLIGRG